MQKALIGSLQIPATTCSQDKVPSQFQKTCVSNPQESRKRVWQLKSESYESPFSGKIVPCSDLSSHQDVLDFKYTKFPLSVCCESTLTTLIHISERLRLKHVDLLFFQLAKSLEPSVSV